MEAKIPFRVLPMLATLVANEIEYRGKIIRCGSLAQMKAALKELEGSKVIREETSWTEEEFQKFTGRIHLPQRRLMAALLEAGPREWVCKHFTCSPSTHCGNQR
jgi:hypothetical protein